jgi:integrase
MADAVGPRFRLLVLLAVFAGLRWGELTGLTRDNVDLDTRIIRVRETVVELKDGSRVFGPPKSNAGLRNVAIPEFLVQAVRIHLTLFASPEPGGHLFLGERGALLRRTTFTKIWNQARIKVELPDVHFHDLRHTGNTLAATTGASLAELMARMGHSSTRAAIIYQHATDDRDKAIADALGDLAAPVWKKDQPKPPEDQPDSEEDEPDEQSGT